MVNALTPLLIHDDKSKIQYNGLHIYHIRLLCLNFQCLLQMPESAVNERVSSLNESEFYRR